MPAPGTYFTVPHNVVDTSLPRLGGAATKVFLYLCRHADASSGQCFRSQATISQGCGFSLRTTRDALAELAESNVIETRNRGQQSNLYRVIYPAKSCRLEPIQTGEILPVVTGEILPDSDLTGEISPSNRRDSASYQTSLSKKKEEAAPSPLSEEKKPAKGKKEPRKLKFSGDDWRTAEWMRDVVHEFNPEARNPELGKWANDIRLMRENDERTDQRIREVFQWAMDHTQFWQGKITTPKKLRDKFDTLTGQMRTSQCKAMSEKPRMATDEELENKGYTRR